MVSSILQRLMRSKSDLPNSRLPAATGSPRLTWRIAAGALVLALAVAVLLLAGLEVGLHLGGYGHPTGFFVKIPGRDAYTTNQRFGWRFFPPPLARTSAVVELAAHKPPNTYRIVILGESAAMGLPEPAFGFGRILRVLLERRYPGVKFEVVNAAITAINSHVILPIAADCARREPDLFVIYAGNNEVVGPYGAGTVFTRTAPSLSMVRLGIWFNSTLTSQLLEAARTRVQKPPMTLRDWGGMAMFSDHRVAAVDPRMPDVYASFRKNLTDICRTAAGSGAQVIVSTVGTNLKDSPPFVSLHREGLPSNLRADWDSLFNRGVAAARTGDHAGAVANFLDAARIDDRFAELHFQLGRCLLALHRVNDARQHFVRARDLDALRFRADTRINEIIRGVAADLAPKGVRLMDAERALEAGGIPEDELFHEHVHLKFSGNYILARSVLETLEGCLPNWVRAAPGGTATTEPQAAEALAFTGWNRYRAAADMFAMMEQPPFTGQFDYETRRSSRKQELLDLYREGTTPQALNAARTAYLAVLQKQPRDIETEALLAQVLSRLGDHAQAAERWRALTLEIPGVARWHVSLADELRDQRKYDQALEETENALRLDPQLILAHFKLGEIFEASGKWDDAAREFGKWLEWRPGDADGHNRLGGVLKRQGLYERAFSEYSEALRLRPDFAEVHNNWGVALQGMGQLEAAILHYSEAVRLKPDFAEAHTNWGVALAGAGRPRESIPHYEQALRLKPNLAAVHNNLGSALEGLGEIQQAIAHYELAVRLKPDFVDAQVNWGMALAKLRQFPGSIVHYQEAIRLRPQDWQARFYLGKSLEALGANRQAMEQYSEALRLRPDFGPARQSLDGLSALIR